MPITPAGSTSANARLVTYGRTVSTRARWITVIARAALRYVELQSCTRARMVETPGSGPRYNKWSSASAHVSAIDGTGLLDLQEWQTCWTAALWKQALENGVGEALLGERLRLATRTGRPLGTRDFAAALEQAMGRSLLPAKRGRKPKEHSVAGLLCAKG